MGKGIHIRNLEWRDLSAIVEIEERLTGVARTAYWEKRIEISEAIRPHWASLVAEVDGRVVGFVFGRTGELEFGLPGTVAWMEIIGVHPAYRRQGVARALMEKLIESAEEHDVKTVFTLVDPQNSQMQQFLSSLGLVQGKMLHFQKNLA